MCLYNGLFMVEDASASHGSSMNGRCAGTFGMAGSFGLAGGGMIVTDSERIAAEARALREPGRRISDAQAAAALEQMAQLDELVNARQRIAARYDRRLVGLPVAPRPAPPTASSSYDRYVVFPPDGVDRPELERRLRDDHGVALDPGVCRTPLHHHAAFREWAVEPLPGAERACATHLCLPIAPTMTDDDVDAVVTALDTALHRISL
jgi:dTDP-4-amino-4,6-dideoxygalactose transaminase